MSIAAVNGPQNVTVSGDPAALDRIERGLSAAGIMRWRLAGVDFAAHSPHVDGIEADLLAALAPIRPRPGKVPFYSTVTASRLDTEELDAGYWCRNLRRTVNFADTADVLVGDGHGLMVEVSPHPVLAHITAAGPVLDTLRRDDGGLRRMLTSLAAADLHGLPVDWTSALPEARAVDLPTYPFQRERYWVTPRSGRPGPRTGGEPPRPVAVPDRLDAAAAVRRSGTVRHLAGRHGPGRRPGRERPRRAAAVRRRGGRPGAGRARPRSPPRAGRCPRAAGPRRGPRAGPPRRPRGFARTVRLVRQLGTAGVEAPLWCVTRDATRSPAQAMTWGFGRVAGFERPVPGAVSSTCRSRWTTPVNGGSPPSCWATPTRTRSASTAPGRSDGGSYAPPHLRSAEGTGRSAAPPW
nr:acyltransferase domain-containing protein [Streptomyces rapamycinicus]